MSFNHTIDPRSGEKIYEMENLISNSNIFLFRNKSQLRNDFSLEKLRAQRAKHTIELNFAELSHSG